MTDTWQPKGLTEYWQEVADMVDDRDLRTVLERYSPNLVNVEDLMRPARGILAVCRMAAHYDEAPNQSEIRKSLRNMKKCAADLSKLLALAPADTAKRLEASAIADDSAELARLERGDPFAREVRLQDATLAVGALARWAERALDSAGAAKLGRPPLGTPSRAAGRLARFYEQLSGRKPTRITTAQKSAPFGYVETGDFGRFASF